MPSLAYQFLTAACARSKERSLTLPYPTHAQIRVLGDEGGKDLENACDDAFLKKIESTMLTQARGGSAL